MLSIILMLISTILLVLSGLNVSGGPRFSLGWCGMAFWAFSILIGMFYGIHFRVGP